MRQYNISTIRGVYDSFARRDFTNMPFDPDIKWIEPEGVEGLATGTHHGPQAVIEEVFEPCLDKLDNFHLQCDQYLSAGNQVIVTGRFLGQGKDTGNELNAPFAHFWTLRDGKVVMFQNYTDTANWLQALYQVHIEQPVGAHM
jgi:ketosteroid isomerase-like protein